MDARLRDALDTSLQTIRIAAQSAMGLLATTGSEAGRRSPSRPGRRHVSHVLPASRAGRAKRLRPRLSPSAPSHRPSGPRRPRIELDDDERRPVFRRPGRR